MQNKWISPSTITGDAATGSRYLRRQHINDYFWQEVEKGNHILFVAPRRVGKTSIMKDLAENPLDGYACIYRDIESVKTKNEFYKRLFELIVQCLQRTRTKKTMALLSKWTKQFKITEITKSGVKFETKEIDYENELRNIIPELAGTDVHTVIFLDEFAEVVNKVNKKDHQQDAIDILHTLREIRSDADFRNFTLVFAGSIGLQFVIKTIDRPKLINDLHPVETGALNEHEARLLVRQLTKNATIRFSNEAVGYLLQKVSHLLPYYIQLMIEETDLLCRAANKPDVTTADIDAAFAAVLKKNKNFDDWLERLKDYQQVHFPFINSILKSCAHKGSITVQEIYNMAGDKAYKRLDDYMDFVEELMNDGYLVEEQEHIYRFISPFLQQYWLKKYPL